MTSYFSPHLLGAEVHITSAHCYGLVQIYKNTGNYHLVGGWPTPLKNISQWEGLSQYMMEIKHVWNHQPAICLGMSGGINIIKHPSESIRSIYFGSPGHQGGAKPIAFFRHRGGASSSAAPIRAVSQAGRPVWHQTNCEYFEHCANSTDS